MYRYCKIKDVAKSSVRYRKLFKAKVGINGLMSFIYLAYMIIVYVTPSHVNLTSWINKCDHENYALLFSIQVIAWAFSCFLLVYEYDRLMSEAWYAN
jgi:hypothetical protein